MCVDIRALRVDVRWGCTASGGHEPCHRAPKFVLMFSQARVGGENPPTRCLVISARETRLRTH